MRSPLAHDTVSPPKRAAATLSGWPSARAAASSSASRDSAFPASAPPATRPATHAAALEGLAHGARHHVVGPGGERPRPLALDGHRDPVALLGRHVVVEPERQP